MPPVSVPPSAAPPDTDASLDQQAARALFDRVNIERENRDLAPVAWDPTLAGYAREWSEHMAELGRLEHRDIDELLQRDDMSGYRSAGENIFRSTAPVPAGRIHVGWMESSGHRHNILQPGFNRLGVGVYCAANGEMFATQEFGRTRGADRPALSDATPPRQPIAAAGDDGPTC